MIFPLLYYLQFKNNFEMFPQLPHPFIYIIIIE